MPISKSLPSDLSGNFGKDTQEVRTNAVATRVNELQRIAQNRGERMNQGTTTKTHVCEMWNRRLVSSNEAK